MKVMSMMLAAALVLSVQFPVQAEAPQVSELPETPVAEISTDNWVPGESCHGADSVLASRGTSSLWGPWACTMGGSGECGGCPGLQQCAYPRDTQGRCQILAPQCVDECTPGCTGISTGPGD
jgi:hypothetical protein